MTTKVCGFPFYDGLGNINTFIRGYGRWVPKSQRLLALDQALRATPARWWGTHKKNIGDWKQCRELMWVRFGRVEIELVDKYVGQNDRRNHIQLYMAAWEEIS